MNLSVTLLLRRISLESKGRVCQRQQTCESLYDFALLQNFPSLSREDCMEREDARTDIKRDIDREHGQRKRTDIGKGEREGERERGARTRTAGENFSLFNHVGSSVEAKEKTRSEIRKDPIVYYPL